MTTAELKQYTARALELESAIYTQERVEKEHQKIFSEKKPIAPPRKECPLPIAPVKPDDDTPKNIRVRRIVGWVSVIGVCSFVMFVGSSLGGYGFLAALGGILPLMGGYASIKKAQKAEEKYFQETEQYEVSLKKYNADQGTYAERRRQVDAENARVLKRYEEEIKTFQTIKENCEKQHRGMRELLAQSLKEHYAEDIIFPKYRNLVAIATIDEYLRSGRCDTLEGPNGAYNLYEMELRQNIVIGQLSSIVRNLEQIKGNQYTLYQEMLKSNELLRTITYELATLNSSVALNNYYASITAMASMHHIFQH